MTRVVAAVDGSEPSRQAVDWAVDEAARRGEPLALVYASLWERVDGGDDQERQAAHDLVAGEARRAAVRRPDVKISTVVVGDETVPALLAQGQDASVLVLGSRGSGGFEGLLLGSVSLRVAGRAEFPVVVVRAGVEGGEGTGHAPYQRVVLGVSSRQPLGRAGEFAIEAARARQAELLVVRGWEPGFDLSGMSVVADAGPAHERAVALAEMTAETIRQAAPDLTVRSETIADTAAAALLEKAAEADLLVVGARKRHRPLGHVAHAVLHHAPCPTAVVAEDGQPASA